MTWEEVWNMPRSQAIGRIDDLAEKMQELTDDDALDQALVEIEFLIHVTRDRIFHDAKERNRENVPADSAAVVSIPDDFFDELFN